VNRNAIIRNVDENTIAATWWELVLLEKEHNIFE
jgi:hypothetical protein